MLLLLALACKNDEETADLPTSPDELGAYGVGHGSFTVTSKGRELPTDVWYPSDDTSDAPPTEYPLAAGFGLPSDVAVDDVSAASGPHPLLVFSHGYGGIHTQSVSLMEALASHGFVVASAEHIGNSQAFPDDDFDTAASNRVPDVSAVLDAMEARNDDDADVLAGVVDLERIGVIGHSFGGMTALGSAAGWAGNAPDPRVDAIAPISAVIDGDLQSAERAGPNAGFTDEQLGEVEIPVMLIGGTEDVDVPVENNQLAMDALTSSEVVYKVDIIGANHTHFANLCDIGNLLLDLGLEQSSWPALGAEDLLEPYEATCTEDAYDIDEAIRLTNLYAVAFFLRHLQDRRDYEHWLTKDYARSEPDILFDRK